MGVPLLVALLGEAAAGPVIGAILVDLVVTSTLCIALAQSQRPPRRAPTTAGAPLRRCSLAARRADQSAAVGDRARRRLRRRSACELPAPIAQIVRMLGDSATPVALFTIGAVLWRAGQHAHTRTPVRHYLPVALIKLLVHPALVFAPRPRRRARSARRCRRSA